ncbi:MAG: 2-C-methyl-D-erythritol 2,4-cyclodiphosphate synthase [Granulosicoccaceae bacterium]
MRIGQGFDVHAFTDGDHLVIGGVRIPFSHQFRAHSDGDVLLHAICDALLGAAGLGDIGRHYPDDDPAYKGIDSRELLRDVVRQLGQRSWQCVNVDAIIIAQAPKMAPYVDKMQLTISSDIGIDTQCVNVKATTSEHLGFTGRGEGIAASASVLLQAVSEN